MISHDFSFGYHFSQIYGNFEQFGEYFERLGQKMKSSVGVVVISCLLFMPRVAFMPASVVVKNLTQADGSND